MIRFIQSLTSLPWFVLAFLAVVTGTGVVGALSLASVGGTTAIAVLVGGVVLLLLVLLGYRLLLKRREKRKADPFERQVKESGGMVPQGVDVAGRARLDDMRKRFEQGIATFRQHGKDLYSLPWYVIIGESGSGKTEAIRHSGIGFPPGLQDQLQGSGGTINMDWWFTNQAVILDTAGRITFGDVDGSDNKEWAEFLRLLGKSRPRCPINGLIIAIPVNSLIQDDAGELERKGGKIAQQLDLIQRSLGVRFPVFVLVTKADMLTGFRPFFSQMRDPRAQGQMLGWSNPAPLDEPFDASAVKKYIDQVKKSLMRRRTLLLQDPVHTEDPEARRTDQVDELFAFPQALERITSRLQHYLAMIFVAGEWSSKPLFLRGIYFTSSMQHGQSLDEELAEALGVAVESLEEAAWTENRSYFLHDTFLEKVFREKGLVTNASDVSAHQRKRKVVLFSSGFAACFVIAFLTLSAWWGYSRELEPHTEFWSAVNTQYEQWDYCDGGLWAVFERAEYRGDAELGELEDLPDGAAVTLAGFFPTYLDYVRDPIDVPWGFKLFAWFAGDAKDLKRDQRIEAFDALFACGVIAPLITEAQRKLSSTGLEWSPQATAALEQLIGVQASVALAAPGKPAPLQAAVNVEQAIQDDEEQPRSRSVTARAFVGDLFAFVLPASDADSVDGTQVADLQDVLDWMYTAGKGERGWPPVQARPADLTGAIDDFNANWESQWQGSSGEIGKLTALREVLGRYSDLEKNLIQVHVVEFGADVWDKRFAALTEARAELVRALGPLDGGLLQPAWREAVAGLKTRSSEAYERLYTATGTESAISIDPPSETEPETEGLGETRAALRAGFRRLDELMQTLGATAKQAEIGQIDDAIFLARAREGDDRLFDVRYKMYEAANATLSVRTTGDEPRFGETATALQSAGEEIGSSRDRINELARLRLAGENPDDRFEQAEKTANYVLDEVGGKARQRSIVAAFVRKLKGASSDDIQEQVAAEAPDRHARQLPGSLGEFLVKSKRFDPGFDAGIAKLLFDDLAQVGAITLDSREHTKRDMESVSSSVRMYAEDYFKYWTESMIGGLRVEDFSWSQLHEALKKTSAGDLADDLDEVGDRIRVAIEALNGGVYKLVRADLGRVLRNLDDGGLTRRKIREYNTVLVNWRRLTDDPIRAREGLLTELSNNTFVDDYFIKPNENLESDGRLIKSFQVRFFSQFCIDALRLLVADSKLAARDGVKGLRTLVAFPLTPLVKGEDQLSVDALADVRELLRRVYFIPDGDTSLNLDGLDEAIRQDMQFLARPLGESDGNWLQDLTAMVWTLPDPSKNDQYSVKVSVYFPPEAEMKHQKLNKRWFNVRMIVGGKIGDFLRVRNRDVSLGTVNYPGEGLKIEFSRKEGVADRDVAIVGRKSNPEDQRLAFSGPWAPHQMLYDAQEAELRTDVWHVRYVLKNVPPGVDGGDSFDLWLLLVFEKNVPPLAAWPRNRQ